MQNFFGVEIDTSNMTMQELQEAKRKTREMLSHIEHQILLKKMSERKLKALASSTNTVKI